MNYLLKNGYFPFSNQIKDIHIKEGLIENISKDIQVEKSVTNIIDLKGKLVISGFVDGHMHLDKAMISENKVNQSGTLSEAIEIMSKYKPNMTKEDIKQRARQTLEQSFENGSRFLRTHIDVDDRIKLRSIEALMELKEEYKEILELQIIAFPQDGINNDAASYAYLEKALQAGADLIGGIPATEDDPVKHMEMIFKLAVKYDVDIDMHIDETDDPSSLTIKDLARLTLANGYTGRVTAGHLCSLAANDREVISPIVDLIKEAKINVISLPSTNLYLQGRRDKKNIRRGITPVKYLIDKDIPVAIGSDNIRDPFNPFGNGNMLEEALIAAHGCQMGGEEDLDHLFDMISIIPGKSLGFNYELEQGNQANFIILDACSKAEAIIKQANLFGYFAKGIFNKND
ncbi:amidohydrolase family protein [Amphibacillus sp. Q70]|uniref:amidohydrolase family protein n=1 Tax=Amphibacillus sp. Q70 TaxID=3453416 RepID=UPI003F83E11E